MLDLLSVGVVLIRGGMAAAHGKIKKKYGMENERDALFTAVEVPSLSEDDHMNSKQNLFRSRHGLQKLAANPFVVTWNDDI